MRLKRRFQLLMGLLGVCLGLIATVVLIPPRLESDLVGRAEELSHILSHRIQNSSYFVIVDYDSPFFRKRLWIVERSTGEVVLSAHVSHARKSGVLYASEFSNQSGSNMSCLGAFVTGEAHHRQFGYSMRIDGLEEEVNSNARARGIVFDSGQFVWSNGCFNTLPDINKKVIDLTNNGCLVYAHKGRRRP